VSVGARCFCRWSSALPRREGPLADPRPHSDLRRQGGLTWRGRCGNLPNGCLTQGAGSCGVRSGTGVMGRAAFRSREAVPAESARADVGGSGDRGAYRAGRARLTGTAVARLADPAGDPAHFVVRIVHGGLPKHMHSRDMSLLLSGPLKKRLSSSATCLEASSWWAETMRSWASEQFR
jgi:hypothetical protein